MWQRNGEITRALRRQRLVITDLCQTYQGIPIDKIYSSTTGIFDIVSEMTRTRMYIQSHFIIASNGKYKRLFFCFRFDKISTRFYWKGSFEEVKTYIENCDKCQRKANIKKAKKPLRSIPVTPDAFKQVGMDLVGPLETTNNGKLGNTSFSALLRIENSLEFRCIVIW